MQLTGGCFQVCGVGAVATISDIIATYTRNICFCLCSLVSSLYSVELFPLNRSGKGLNAKAVVLSSPLTFGPRSTEDGSLALRALAVLSGSTDPSCSVFRGNLVPVSILRDDIRSNQVGSNPAEQTIDNCAGMKHVQS